MAEWRRCRGMPKSKTPLPEPYASSLGLTRCIGLPRLEIATLLPERVKFLSGHSDLR